MKKETSDLALVRQGFTQMENVWKGLISTLSSSSCRSLGISDESFKRLLYGMNLVKDDVEAMQFHLNQSRSETRKTRQLARKAKGLK